MLYYISVVVYQYNYCNIVSGVLSRVSTYENDLPDTVSSDWSQTNF